MTTASRALRLGMLVLLALQGGAASAATEQPLWELGAGASVLRLPHYRGSDQAHTWLLPIPYAVYRGSVLRADREGARAVMFEQGSLELNVSAAGSAPTRSEDNVARAGMPDLPATLELGPSLQWHLLRSADWDFSFRLPVRAVIALETPLRLAGWTATPQVRFQHRWPGWKLNALVGAPFGDQRVHALFYEVAPAFANADRPAYAARAGRAGFELLTSVSHRVGNLWFGAYLRADRLDEAVFADSPLVRQNRSLAGGFAVSWVFAQSSRRVWADD